jgi:transcriptional regulator GlxA family with amidase domain
MLRLLVLVTPNFNLAATAAFIDPLRASNYLDGASHFRWKFASPEGGRIDASNGMSVLTTRLTEVVDEPFDIVLVSSSWAPEAHSSPHLVNALRRWARAGVTIGALDTGAFILAEAGLLEGLRATVHYEHIDSFHEVHEGTNICEEIFVLESKRFTCSGGLAAADLGLQIVRTRHGDALANAAARYIFHPGLRPQGTPQNPASVEPLGHSTPGAVRRAIDEMERNLEEPLSIPELCRRVGRSQRQIDRLFARYVGKSPTLYYRDIRLDRARGLVTQTELSMSEIAVASGFSSQVHFSKAYRERFRISPRSDRVEGRIPFEFRAWPMHRHAPGNGEK